MRNAADPDRIRTLARELGRIAPPGTRMYLTGGTTAVLEGWRQSTVNVDVRFEPDSDVVLRHIAKLKDRLSLNVELASPLDFLPALSKLERGFELDLAVDPASLRETVEALARGELLDDG